MSKNNPPDKSLYVARIKAAIDTPMGNRILEEYGQQYAAYESAKASEQPTLSNLKDGIEKKSDVINNPAKNDDDTEILFSGIIGNIRFENAQLTMKQLRQLSEELANVEFLRAGKITQEKSVNDVIARIEAIFRPEYNRHNISASEMHMIRKVIEALYGA